jgi:hypothetical protein
MKTLSPRQYHAILRSDFPAFAVRCFTELYPQTELAMNGHILVMASRLSMVREGQIRRLIITVPPRHLKSLIGTVAFPSWCLGHNPSASIIVSPTRRSCRKSTPATAEGSSPAGGTVSCSRAHGYHRKGLRLRNSSPQRAGIGLRLLSAAC